MLICNTCEKTEEEVKIYKKSGICVNCKSKLNYQKVKETKLKKQREYYSINKEKHALLTKRYYEENKEELSKRHIKYNIENKEKCKEYYDKYTKTDKAKERNKRYYEKNKEEILRKLKEYNSRDYVVEKNKIYRQDNKESINIRINKWSKDREKLDKVYKLKNLISASIRSSFNYKKIRKNTRSVVILGCSFEYFKSYLESKFEDWMNWDNQGKYNGELYYGWDIDHIIPISTAKTEEDIIRLNHYTNLQPLCSYTNRCIKKDTI
jgi:hypothetical protein